MKASEVVFLACYRGNQLSKQRRGCRAKLMGIPDRFDFRRRVLLQLDLDILTARRTIHNGKQNLIQSP